MLLTYLELCRAASENMSRYTSVCSRLDTMFCKYAMCCVEMICSVYLKKAFCFLSSVISCLILINAGINEKYILKLI